MVLQKLVKNPHISFLPSAQEGPEHNYLHEVNTEDFEGTSYLVPSYLVNPPSKMPKPQRLKPYRLWVDKVSCPSAGLGLYDQPCPLRGWLKKSWTRENWSAFKCMTFIKKIPMSFCITSKLSSRLCTDALWDPRVCGSSWWLLIWLPAFTWALPVVFALACLALPVDIIPISVPHIWQYLPPTSSYWPNLPSLKQHLVISPWTSENVLLPYTFAR